MNKYKQDNNSFFHDLRFYYFNFNNMFRQKQ